VGTTLGSNKALLFTTVDHGKGWPRGKLL